MARKPPINYTPPRYSIDTITSILDSMEDDTVPPKSIPQAIKDMLAYLNSIELDDVKKEALDYLLEMLQRKNKKIYISFTSEKFKSNFEESLWPCQLCIAIKTMDVDMFQWLLNHNYDVNYDKDTNTPLIEATLKGREYFAQELINQGADVNLVNKANLSPIKASLIPCMGWTIERVELLLKHNVFFNQDLLSYAKTLNNAKETVDILNQQLIKIDKTNIEQEIKVNSIAASNNNTNKL